MSNRIAAEKMIAHVAGVLAAAQQFIEPEDCVAAFDVALSVAALNRARLRLQNVQVDKTETPELAGPGVSTAIASGGRHQ